MSKRDGRSPDGASRPLLHAALAPCKEQAPALLLVLIGTGVFAFFKAFFDLGLSPLSTEILAAVLGAVMTVLITMMLLQRQTVSESEMETVQAARTAKFERKLELFRGFIECYVIAAADEQLSPHELRKLEELALSISLFTEGEAGPTATSGKRSVASSCSSSCSDCRGASRAPRRSRPTGATSRGRSSASRRARRRCA